MDHPESKPTSLGRRSTSVSQQARDILRAAKVSKNAAVSTLAVLPLVPTVVVVLLVIDVVQLSYVSIAFCVAVGAVLSVVLAREDTRILRARGFDDVYLPSSYIAGIAPWLYLWLRGHRLFRADPRSLRPFWQHAGLVIVFWLTLIAFPTVAGIGGILLEMQ